MKSKVRLNTDSHFWQRQSRHPRRPNAQSLSTDKCHSVADINCQQSHKIRHQSRVFMSERFSPTSDESARDGLSQGKCDWDCTNETASPITALRLSPPQAADEACRTRRHQSILVLKVATIFHFEDCAGNRGRVLNIRKGTVYWLPLGELFRA
jgi:hypothetical protein